MLKISNYNHFQTWENGYIIAYNARSGAVGLMTADNYALYQKIAEKLSNGGNPGMTPEEQTLINQLSYGSFVYSDDIDEIEGLRFQHNLARYDSSELGLTIAPTMACNMACEYCYEDNKKGRMSATVIESIIDFIEKRAKRLKKLEISWYGGEPLLAIDIIDDLTRSFLDLAEEYKFEYTVSMISNGYLLNKENVDRLRDLKVSGVQITLDGPARFHNQKRPLKNGKPSFETIIENLKYASTKIGVGIRVNVDKSFTNEIIGELLDELDKAGLRQTIGVYFGLLEPATSACANISENCYENSDFSKVEIDYYKILLEKGFRIDKLPSPTVTFCMAQSISSFLIDPDGELYRCFNYAGDKAKSMGNIRDEINYRHANFMHLFRFEPFNDNTCLVCNLLPVCGGGCPSRRADRDLDKEKLCDSWKHNLQPMLEIIARSRQQLAQAAKKE
jgi:uncharacterized protein